ncbi:DUF4129 domain-containing protein [Actinoplanes sp. NPDC051861]|uniref:DUF4129 domain-containing protein n=1 Tax=Actinoplanes sp. NPDC051861 TaxID=3155170 RepID=UPI00344205BA
MRWYDERVASVLDVVPPRVMLLLLFAVTLLTSVLWYSYPRWLKVRLRMPRLRLPKRPKRPKRAARKPEPAVIGTPAGAARDLALADRLAAEGRYAEAIRERLRDTVTDLAHAGVIEPQPGWTAAELSAIAAAELPPLGPALGGATDLFSQVWYGRLPARADEDERMRALTGEVRSALGGDR